MAERLLGEHAEEGLTANGPQHRPGAFGAKAAALDEARATAARLTLSPAKAAQAGLPVKADGVVRNVVELLAYPTISFEDLSAIWPELDGWAPEIREQLEIDASYAGYLDRQAADVAAFRRDEDLRLPPELDYGAVGGLSNEVREKLAAIRPLTLGQAARIEGVTPGALTALLAHVRRKVAA